MQNRYEEYTHLAKGLPFAVSFDISRSAARVSAEANWHENIELQLCTEGAGCVLLDGRSVPFRAGEVVAIGSQVIHHTGSEAGLVYSCIILDADFCRDAGIEPRTLRLCEHFVSPAISALFSEIRRVFQNTDDPCRIARLRLLALSLLIELREKHTLSTDSAPDTAENETVKEAIRYIRAHCIEPISLADVAGAIYVNKYVLARRFRAATRETVVGYIRTLRCQEAKRLLEGGASVAETAAQCGFCNVSFFSRSFRACTGLLPSEYRKGTHKKR